ncbi:MULTISPECIES: hypothetical protein [Klebsiella/Raoultella group]|jgi:hypothetical protein|uniref:hypothetical protein n=1 Tax=Klebsiella/Raoultella group TaxID=2890311 RepID=UPI0013B011DE|nr:MULTISPECIES: hypothetical protein [Klebsiella/Raoultella group]MDM4273736.1 hypothetical protein [Klebsiella oxytoca]
MEDPIVYLDCIVGFVNGMVASLLLCHSETMNPHYLSGAAIMNVKTIGIDLAKEVF